MTTIGNIPVTITPAAAGHVEGWGLQREFQQMIDHTLQTVPSLRRIEVTLDECPFSDSPTEPAVMIAAFVPMPDEPDAQIEWDWSAWSIATFSPAIGIHFVFVVRDAATNER